VGALSDPAHRDALISAFEDREPDGGTPMSAALEGAAAWARDHRATHPDEQVAIVLVTDGEPNGCDEDIPDIAAVAAQSAADGAPVFAVGIVGVNEATIDQIAAAGGTTDGTFVGSADVEQELLAALVDIQEQVVACSFRFPEGEELNPDLVRVEYADGAETVVVPRVVDAAACAPDGWYLDGELITLCPTTCDELGAIADVSIAIAVGCECEVDEDCPELHACSQQQCVPCTELDRASDRCPPDTSLGSGEVVQGGALWCGTAARGGFPGWLVAALVALLRRRG
jgi:hypothetical protein